MRAVEKQRTHPILVAVTLYESFGGDMASTRMSKPKVHAEVANQPR